MNAFVWTYCEERDLWVEERVYGDPEELLEGVDEVLENMSDLLIGEQDLAEDGVTKERLERWKKNALEGLDGSIEVFLEACKLLDRSEQDTDSETRTEELLKRIEDLEKRVSELERNRNPHILGPDPLEPLLG